jgi:hypothetical protein
MFMTGQKVVCVDDKFPAWILAFYTALPVKDTIYVVRGTTVGISVKGEEGELCVYLEGIVNPNSEKPPYRERGFKAERFAPLETNEEAETSYEYEPQEELEPA